MKHILASLPEESVERFKKLAEDGFVCLEDLDAASLKRFQGLRTGLQDNVLTYIENNCMYFMYAKSKSGFLVGAIDRAQFGAADVKGFGNEDPYRSYLLSIATPRKDVSLLPEKQWLEQHGSNPVSVTVDMSADTALGLPSVKLEANLTRTGADLKRWLVVIGCTVPVNKMRLFMDPVGFFRDDRTLAFYNVQAGSVIHFSVRTRGGVRHRRVD